MTSTDEILKALDWFEAFCGSDGDMWDEKEQADWRRHTLVLLAHRARLERGHDLNTGPCPMCFHEITTDSSPWKETEPCPTCKRPIAFYPHVKARLERERAFVEASMAEHAMRVKLPKDSDPYGMWRDYQSLVAQTQTAYSALVSEPGKKR